MNPAAVFALVIILVIAAAEAKSHKFKRRRDDAMKAAVEQSQRIAKKGTI